MKKLLIIAVVLLVAAVITACVPENPKDVLPFCQTLYEIQLAEFPDYPHAFIGACVAYYQSGNTNAMVPLCKYESFRASIDIAVINTQEECVELISNLEE